MDANGGAKTAEAAALMAGFDLRRSAIISGVNVERSNPNGLGPTAD
jgi:hypothetical protein